MISTLIERIDMGSIEHSSLNDFTIEELQALFKVARLLQGKDFSIIPSNRAVLRLGVKAGLVNVRLAAEERRRLIEEVTERLSYSI